LLGVSPIELIWASGRFLSLKGDFAKEPCERKIRNPSVITKVLRIMVEPEY
jgi:hypothetical protein